MGEHGMFIMSDGKTTWAECECDWASGSCSSPAEASVRWSQHLRQVEAREALKEISGSSK